MVDIVLDSLFILFFIKEISNNNLEYINFLNHHLQKDKYYMVLHQSSTSDNKGDRNRNEEHLILITWANSVTATIQLSCIYYPIREREIEREN